MKRFQTMIAVLAIVLVASSAFATNEPYTWSISDSSADPLSNTGAFVPGLATFYLWLACCNLPDPLQDGWAAAQFSLLSKNPANIILATTPINGVINAASGVDMLIAVGGCPCGPFLAVSILTLMNAPGGFALIPFEGEKTTVDCEPVPTLHPMAWIGYSNDGTAPQSKGELCKEDPTAVEDSSFGQVKALYR